LTITICHSAADLACAGELHRYVLENFGGDVCRRVVEGSVSEAVDFALSGDRAIVLLSPDAAPIVEDGWEDVMLHEHVFYLLVRDCRFPPLIRRNKTRFTDARSDRLSAYRAAKCWLLGHREPSEKGIDEELRRELADKPGFAERDLKTAARFAEHSAAEFGHLCIIDGRGRTLPSVQHEIRRDTGARLRVLIVLRGASPELADALSCPPFASLLRTPSEPAPPEDAAKVRSELVEALNSHGDVNEAAFDCALHNSTDPEFIRLAVAWLRRSGRPEEALAALDRILKGRPALSDLARERAWLLDELSGSVQPPLPVAGQAKQLTIPFVQPESG
jgi:hypothetical protein